METNRAAAAAGAEAQNEYTDTDTGADTGVRVGVWTGEQRCEAEGGGKRNTGKCTGVLRWPQAGRPHKSFMAATRVHKLKLAYNCLFNCFCRMRGVSKGRGRTRARERESRLAYLHIAVKITFLWANVNHSCAIHTKPPNVDYINMPKRRRVYCEYSFVRDY